MTFSYIRDALAILNSIPPTQVKDTEEKYFNCDSTESGKNNVYCRFTLVLLAATVENQRRLVSTVVFEYFPAQTAVG